VPGYQTTFILNQDIAREQDRLMAIISAKGHLFGYSEAAKRCVSLDSAPGTQAGGYEGRRPRGSGLKILEWIDTDEHGA
jgi:hypothetical protein